MHNRPVLVGEVYCQLASVMERSYAVIRLAEERADEAVIARAVVDAQAAVDELGRLLAPRPIARVTDLRRHLHWIERRYRENKHDDYRSDLADIRQTDLPAVASAVADWERSFYDPRLIEATERAWNDRDYLAVARDAFVHVEERLRAAGHVSPSTGLSGDRLVTLVLGRSSGDRIDLPNGPFKPLTAGEEEGVYNFFKGMFLLFRNAAAHRSIGYGPEDAQLVLGVAEMCLRLIEGPRVR